jgi:hypothetical protein
MQATTRPVKERMPSLPPHRRQNRARTILAIPPRKPEPEARPAPAASTTFLRQSLHAMNHASRHGVAVNENFSGGWGLGGLGSGGPALRPRRPVEPRHTIRGILLK